MRKPGGARHGIVRIIDSKYDFITEATYYENKPHGLSFTWDNDPDIAFVATIYDQGEFKARIMWKDDWEEYGSSVGRGMILENNGLSLFKP